MLRTWSLKGSNSRQGHDLISTGRFGESPDTDKAGANEKVIKTPEESENWKNLSLSAVVMKL
jgi:hypothetical protein